MKRNVKMGIVAMMFAVLLGGCGATIPDMTDKQTELMTEYAANLLIKYSTESNRSLLNEKELEAELEKEEKLREKERKKKEAAEAYLAASQNSETNEEDTETEENKEGNGTQATDATLSDLGGFFELSDFAVTPNGYSICQTYPETSEEEMFFVMESTAGKQLCVVKFNVENVSGAEQDFDMFAKQGRFTLTINGTEKASSQSTLLLDDLSSYKGVIAPGTSEPMVLIFEIDEAVTQIDTMTLDVRYGSEKGTVVIQ